MQHMNLENSGVFKCPRIPIHLERCNNSSQFYVTKFLEE